MGMGGGGGQAAENNVSAHKGFKVCTVFFYILLSLQKKQYPSPPFSYFVQY